MTLVVRIWYCSCNSLNIKTLDYSWSEKTLSDEYHFLSVLIVQLYEEYFLAYIGTNKRLLKYRSFPGYCGSSLRCTNPLLATSGSTKHHGINKKMVADCYKGHSNKLSVLKLPPHLTDFTQNIWVIWQQRLESWMCCQPFYKNCWMP